MPAQKETPSLTPRQALIVKAKVESVLQGKSQRSIARKVYPNAAQAGAEVNLSKELKKTNVKLAVAEALAKHGISVEAAIKPIADGLTAEKVSIVGNGDQAFAEVTPDHSIRLKASGMALRLMGADQPQEGGVSVHFHNHQADQKQAYDL